MDSFCQTLISVGDGEVLIHTSSGKTVRVPDSVVERSVVLCEALDTEIDKNEIRIVAPEGYVDHWAMYSTGDECAADKATIDLLHLLRVADFLQDWKVSEDISNVLAGRLLAPRTQASIDEILQQVPEALLVDVLKGCPTDLDGLMERLSSQWQQAAVHSCFPSIQQEASLELDFSKLTASALALVVQEFAGHWSPEEVDLRHLVLASPHDAEAGQSDPQKSEMFSTMLVVQSLRPTLQAVSLSIDRCDMEWMSLVVLQLAACPTLEHISLEIHPQAAQFNVPKALALLAEHAVPGDESIQQQLLDHVPQVSLPAQILRAFTGTTLTSFRLVSYHVFDDVDEKDHLATRSNLYTPADVSSLYGALMMSTQLTRLCVEWCPGEPTLAKRLLYNLPALQDLEIQFVRSNGIEQADLAPVATGSTLPKCLTRLAWDVTCSDALKSDFMRARFNEDAVSDEWAMEVFIPLMKSSKEFCHLNLHHCMTNNSELSGAFVDALAPLTGLNSLEVYVAPWYSNFVAVVGQLTAMRGLTRLHLSGAAVSENDESQEDIKSALNQLHSLQNLSFELVVSGSEVMDGKRGLTLMKYSGPIPISGNI